jgi:hypothetical protein
METRARRRSAPRAPRTVAECVEAPAHAGSLEGAPRIGEAARDGRLVRIGVWGDGPGIRARFRSSTCASLIAYAEVGCSALEAGAVPDASDLRAALRGVHPAHEERAELVADAIRAALAEESP